MEHIVAFGIIERVGHGQGFRKGGWHKACLSDPQREEYNSGIIVNEDAVKLLKRIVDATGASIILTSSRRFTYADFVKSGYQVIDEDAIKHMAIFQELLEKYDLYIDGITGRYESGPISRPLEIRTWLLPRTGIQSFVILDDDDFWKWEYMSPHFVRTVTELPKVDEDRLFQPVKRGLTQAHAEEAIHILNMFDCRMGRGLNI